MARGRQLQSERGERLYFNAPSKGNFAYEGAFLLEVKGVMPKQDGLIISLLEASIYQTDEKRRKQMKRVLLILSLVWVSILFALPFAYAAEAQKIIFASQIVDVIGPSVKMIGPIQSGGIIVATPEAACYGPMITPQLRSGHTMTIPVAVEGAEVGDSIALKIKRVRVLAKATASGTETAIEGRFAGDPFVAKRCPKCGAINPPTEIK